MRVRLTIEYDTDEDLAYEKQAWIEGDVDFHDFFDLSPYDDSIRVKLEPVDGDAEQRERLQSFEAYRRAYPEY